MVWSRQYIDHVLLVVDDLMQDFNIFFLGWPLQTCNMEISMKFEPAVLITMFYFQRIDNIKNSYSAAKGRGSWSAWEYPRTARSVDGYGHQLLHPSCNL